MDTYSVKTVPAVITSAPPDYSPRIVAAGVAVPDFAAEWAEIRRDLEGEAAGALRVGRSLITIRDALKPRGLWLKALREHGMSQPQANRYVRYAELPERDREAFQRVNGFSLSAAVGETRSKKAAAAEAGAAPADEAPIPESELSARVAEVNWWLKQAVATMEAGEAARGTEPPPDYAGNAELWGDELGELVTDAIAVLEEGLGARLRKRLLPGPGA
jgi:hypothetical protein